MNSNSRAWQDLGAAWRGSDWSGCVAILRPIVEELPEVLSTRLLLAGFATQAKNPGLALLHFEKLMVLAVGQGELFHALAAERGLDGLRSDEVAHRKRLQALQQWFRTMPGRARGRKTVTLPQSWMLDLPAADFRRYAEASRLVVLPPRPLVLENAPDVFAIVLHGEANWTYHPTGEDALPAVRAAGGDVISPPAGCEAGDHLSLEPVEPGVLLFFDPPVAASLRERVVTERRTAQASRTGGDPKPAEPAAAPAPAVMATGLRPLPDPVLEPLASRFPSHDRRREHELVVRVERGEVELGVAGTRTGAIAGRLAELSPAGLTVTVPRATVRQSRAALEGAHVVTQVALPGDEEPLRLAGRVTALSFEAGTLAAGPRAQLAVEFVLMLAPARARLQEALIEATRSGTWPWAEGAALPLDSQRPAA